MTKLETLEDIALEAWYGRRPHEDIVAAITDMAEKNPETLQTVLRWLLSQAYCVNGAYAAFYFNEDDDCTPPANILKVGHAVFNMLDKVYEARMNLREEALH